MADIKMQLPESILTKSQAKGFRAGVNQTTEIIATVRHDDSCGNGHNTFSITGEIWERQEYRTPSGKRKGRREMVAGGCIHDEIAAHFPKLAPLIKWHLTSTDGPMHYYKNVIYLAGDRDCWGTRKGEVRQTETRITFGENPILHSPGSNWTSDKFMAWLQECGPRCGYDFEIIALHHDPEPDGRRLYDPKYTFGGYPAQPNGINARSTPKA